MTTEVEVNGKMIPFPDDWTESQISATLSAVKDPSFLENHPNIKNILEFTKGHQPKPMLSLRGIAGGLAGNIQDIAALVGEQGQKIGALAKPLQKYVPESMKIFPDVNIREAMGDSGERPSLETMIGGEGNKGSKFIGRSIIPAMMGGASLPGLATGEAFNAAIRHPEGERLNPALWAGGTTYLGGKLLQKALPWASEKIGQLGSWLSPGKASEQYMRNLISAESGRALPTDIENIADLTKRMKLGRTSAEQEALIPKQQLFETESENRIFPAHESPLIKMQPFKFGEYMNLPHVAKNYRGMGLEEVHGNFSKNPSLKNADELLSAMKKEYRDLQERIQMKKADGSDKSKFRRLSRNIGALTNDLEKFVKSLPQEKQGLYRNFLEKWKSNVPKYHESGNVIRQLSEGKPAGLTREEVSGALKGEPTEQIAQILSDIGPSGQSNIVYNRLLSGSPNDARALANAIIESRRSGGYSHLIGPEAEIFANELLKRLGHQKAAKIAGAALGTGILGATGYNIGRHL